MATLRLILPLAWRNLWRHRRRTLLTMFSILLAVASMVALGAFMRAWSNSAFDEAISNLTGHGQIHAPGYLDDPSAHYRLPAGPEQRLPWLNSPAVRAWTARVRVPAMLLSERESSPVELVGVDPAREAALSFVAQAVRDGEFLSAANGIVIGRALAERLQTVLGRRLVVMTQGADGSLKERGFQIVGIFDSLLPREQRFAFVRIEDAQRLLEIGSDLTEISYLLKDPGQAEAQSEALTALMPEWDTRSWEVLEPFTKAMQEMSEGTILIWILVSFTVVAFGLVNTLLMAVYERMREFGLLQALGMRPAWLLLQLLAEALLMVGLAVIGGLALGSGLVIVLKGGLDLGAGASFLGVGRRLYPTLELTETLYIGGVVLFLGVLASVYPAFKAAREVPIATLTRNMN